MDHWCQDTLKTPEIQLRKSLRSLALHYLYLFYLPLSSSWFQPLAQLGSWVAQMVKNLPAMQETWVPIRKRAWQPTPVFLPGESPQTEEPGRLQSMGSQRVSCKLNICKQELYNNSVLFLLCNECIHITSWKYVMKQKKARTTSCFMFSSHNILKNFWNSSEFHDIHSPFKNC